MPVSKVDELKSDLEELKKMHAEAKRHRVQGVLSIEIRKVETELSKAVSLGNNTKTNSEGSRIPTAKCYEVKLNTYSWYQSENFVKVFVSLEKIQDLPADQVFCKFTDRSMELNVKNLEGRNYLLPINNLLEPIDPEKSHWKVKSDKIVVFLAKKTAGRTWSHVTGTDKREHDAKAPKLSDDDGMASDPSAGLMSVLKQMYETGDDNLKRTIAQAWTQSQDQQLRGGGGPKLGLD